MKRSVWFSALSAFALSAGLCVPSFGQLTGTVKLDGPAPKRMPINMSAVKDCAAQHKDPVLDESVIADDKGMLANVVVFLKGENLKGKGTVPKDPVVIDQKGCMYTPHVSSLTIGQDLIAANSDGFLHNFHSLPENNEPTNIAQPKKDNEPGTKTKALKTPELAIKVKCDVHPWMGAYVAVFDHPFHSVSAEDGTYEVDVTGLPDGEYTAVAWHEKFKESAPVKVSIKGGKAEANFTIKPKAAAANPTGPEREVVLTSVATPTAAAKKPCCEKCDETKATTPVAAPAATVTATK